MGREKLGLALPENQIAGGGEIDRQPGHGAGRHSQVQVMPDKL